MFISLLFNVHVQGPACFVMLNINQLQLTGNNGEIDAVVYGQENV